jgi:hypothetical protein
MTADGWDAIVEDPTNEADIQGCVFGQLRCTSNTGALLSVPSLDEEEEAASTPPSMSMMAPTPGPIEPDPIEVEPEPVDIGVTFELSFNNRGYIRGIDDAWVPETLFLQHENCSGSNQRRRIDITPTGQVSSCSLPCDSTAVCP